MSKRRDAYYQYLDSPIWAAKRKEKIKSLGSKPYCERCKLRGKYIFQTHHTLKAYKSLKWNGKKYLSLGSEKLKDLIVLCRRCHEFLHDLYHPIYKFKKDDFGEMNPIIFIDRKKIIDLHGFNKEDLGNIQQIVLTEKVEENKIVKDELDNKDTLNNLKKWKCLF